MVLEKINSPSDIKYLDDATLNILAEDIRKGIINRVNTVGGHLGPDLGFVEPTIALHYVFNSPKDKFVFDVSHQIYPHKMLTGRKEGFLNPKENYHISGYSNPAESEHDTFVIGHTSTSVSLATGIAKARNVRGEKYNVIAIIGDGSLSGGEAFEGLDNGALLNSNFIVIVNDNEMSIAENVGGLYKNLKDLRDSNGNCENNYFKALGYDYYYLDEGNDIRKLIDLFSKVKDTNKPTVVHLHTLKGKGYKPAEEDKESFHWALPGFLDNKSQSFISGEDNYYAVTNKYLLEKVKSDNSVIVINPATPGAVGFSKDFRKALGNNYTDTGIAEEHAVAYSSALAKYGAKPVLAILSSFVQRTYDQLSQDLALNSSPATILVYWGGITSADMTHLCCFDIPLISNIPNIVHLNPTTKEEYLNMLNWSTEQTQYPVVIRVPNIFKTTGTPDNTDYSQLNKYKVKEIGSQVALIGLGDFYWLADEVKEELRKHNINPTMINPIFASGLDEETLSSLTNSHKIVVTLENGVLDGGFGEKISRYFGDKNIKVLNYGQKKEFTDRTPEGKLYTKYRLTKEQITEDILRNI